MIEEKSVNAVYGYCPKCGARGVSRERRPNGNDTCEGQHKYPSSTAAVLITESCQTPRGNMILTIKNRKDSVDFRSLYAGDFFLLNGSLCMKLGLSGSHEWRAIRFNDDGDIVVEDIGWGLMVEPVKIAEIIVERLT